MNLLLAVARLGAALAFFAVLSSLMIWALVWAGQGWVSLYEVLVDAGGYMRQAGEFLGWLVFVLRIDYFLSVVVFVKATDLMRVLWWSIKGSV